MTHGPQNHSVIVGVLAVLVMAFLLGRGLLSLLRSAQARRRAASAHDLGSPVGGSAPSPPTAPPRMNGHGGGRRHRTSPPSAPDGAIVRVTGLTKRYGDFVAVDELTFSLDPRTITGFLGPNGAGKTTTLRLLLGLADPSAGEALVLGSRYADLDQPIRRVGAVLESNDFHPGRSGRDHLRVLALAADLPPSRVEEVLDLVDLGPAASRHVKTYSLGMRQRLGLAAALLGDPGLLVLDEPANGLDPVGVHWLRTFLRSFADDGGTVLVSSHVLAEVAQTVDRVLIIDRGHLVADALLDELAGRGRSLEDAYLALTAGDPS